MPDRLHAELNHLDGIHVLAAWEVSDWDSLSALVVTEAEVGKVARVAGGERYRFALLVAVDEGRSEWRELAPDLSLGDASPSNVMGYALISEESGDHELGTAFPGESNAAAREDHVHPILTGPPMPIGLSSSLAEGISAEIARADHQHALDADVLDRLASPVLDGARGDWSQLDQFVLRGMSNAASFYVPFGGSVTTGAGSLIARSSSPAYLSSRLNRLSLQTASAPGSHARIYGNFPLYINHGAFFSLLVSPVMNAQTARWFAGWASIPNSSVLATADASSEASRFGIGTIDGSPNLHVIATNHLGSVVRVDLGASFPARVAQYAMYKLTARVTDSEIYDWSVRRIEGVPNVIQSGRLESVGPRADVPLYPSVAMFNGTETQPYDLMIFHVGHAVIIPNLR